MTTKKMGKRIDILHPDGSLTYIKSVSRLNKARDIDAYRSQLHYGYAVRVTHKASGKHLDMQCYRPKIEYHPVIVDGRVVRSTTVDNQLKAIEFMAKYERVKATLKSNKASPFVKAQPRGARRKGRASMEIVPINVTPTKSTLWERLKPQLRSSLFALLLYIDSIYQSVMTEFGRLQDKMAAAAGEKVKVVDLNEGDYTVLPDAPAPKEEEGPTPPWEDDPLPLPETTGEDNSESSEQEVTEIPGLPRVVWPKKPTHQFQSQARH